LEYTTNLFNKNAFTRTTYIKLYQIEAQGQIIIQLYIETRTV